MFKIILGLLLLIPTHVTSNISTDNQRAPAYENWNWLSIQPENRCSPYNRKVDYAYEMEIENAIVTKMNGHVYEPYTGRYFSSSKQTDIEHIVATSEAHDSGLCSRTKEVRQAFASDLLNLTLATPKINRCSKTGKCALDAGEWLPEENKCWFASRIVLVKKKYRLSMDRKEFETLKSILANCDNLEMFFHTRASIRETLVHP